MDDERLRELYEGCYGRLIGQLFAVCGDLAEAEDVVQEAFVQGLTKRRQLGQVDNPEAWLRTIALNVARNRFRRTVRLRQLLRLQPRPVTLPGLSPDRIALVDALRRLPLDQREAIALRHIADLSVREIAETLGIPEGTVKARLSRGRQRLAPLVHEFVDDPQTEEHHV
ncbi:SigE family RNA polymerase sigma factor [Kribbella sandramycini]|uniref:RNA polymerase sigma factor n=1 Tax=Kribbella sandramycini TaxID=60450 RepID=A0A7Y4KYA8_9ACTN|nr:SigE family RNA polymerase sigma factor [Kribbella sandramycini]MBB6569255.1 RNA polymerase sigma-70 factor (ECF subfamily) [Kribbella sandramycini]NOL40904.1 SigE family RNA polymerase sigma factor [Kribbella sandramycini]